MKNALFLLMFAMGTASSALALPATDFPILGGRAGLAPYGRQNVEIAASRDQSLAVWEDNRSFPATPRIFGTRIAGPGVVVDPLGFPIVTLGPSDAKTHIVAIASDGNDFMVAFTTRGDLHFIHVTSEAVVGEVQTPGVTADQVAMVWIGFGYAVFVTDTPSNGELSSTVRVFVLDRDGRFATSPSVAVLSPGIASIAAVSSADGNDAVLAWIDTTDQAVHLQGYSTAALRNGQPAAVQQVPFQGSTSKLSALGLATNGIEFFATWVELQNGLNSYRGRRFTQGGVPIAPAVTLGPAVDTNPLRPVTAWDGTQYVVTMRTKPSAGVEAGFFRADGSPATAQPVLVGEGNVPDASVASTGAYSVFVWNEVRPGGVSEIFADAVTPGGGLRYGAGQSALLSRSAPDVTEVSVVWQGDHYLAAWLETSDTTRAVIGRFTPNGDLLDGNGITISAGARASAPSLATDGTIAIVSWADASGVTISSVDGGGHVVRVAGPYPALIERPAAHWNGSQFVVFWRSAQILTAIRLAKEGRVLDAQPVAIGPADGAPVAGWTGTEYVVVMRQGGGNCIFMGNDDPRCKILRVQFVSSSLSAIGSRMQLLGAAGTPTVVEGLSGSLIVFAAPSASLSGASTMRAFRAAHGAVLDSGFGIEVGPGESPTAFASGTGWVVVSGPYTWTVSSDGTVGPRMTTFGFVPPGAVSMIVVGGPSTLVVYRRLPIGNEQMAQVLGRFLFQPRHRPVRH